MKKPKPIQINIPNPCQQDWDKMTPTDQGHFCTQCQKTVIDFTAYTDAQLYEFFTKHTGHVCGKYLASQVNRDICIPYQPHSKLYKWVIAAGLVLMFTQVPIANAQPRPPQVSVVHEEKNNKQDHSFGNVGSIAGVVIDETKQPVIGAVVELWQSGVKKTGAATDVEGNYSFQSLPLGDNYELTIKYVGYKHNTKKVAVHEGTEIRVNFALELEKQLEQNAYFVGYKIPLIDPLPVTTTSALQPAEMPSSETAAPGYQIPLGSNSLGKEDIGHMR